MATEMTKPKTAIKLRAPSSHAFPGAKPPTATVVEPPLSNWLKGPWHVTHSTLPMWKGKCNVCITYTPIHPDPADSKATSDMDDLVEYQKDANSKVSRIHGVSRITTVPDLEKPGLAFSWRGKGLLMIASSKWEILGWGDELGSNSWVVTYFGKTLFTPAGIDVYSRSTAGVSEATLSGIKEAFQTFEESGLKKLAGELFEVPVRT